MLICQKSNIMHEPKYSPMEYVPFHNFHSYIEKKQPIINVAVSKQYQNINIGMQWLSSKDPKKNFMFVNVHGFIKKN